MCQCWNASLLLVQAQPGLALDYPPPRGGRGWAKAELYVWGEGARKELVEAASLSPPPAPPLKTESGGGVARVSLRAWEERRSDQATKPGPDAAPLPPSGMRRGSGSEAPPLFSPPPQSAAFLHPPSGSSLARALLAPPSPSRARFVCAARGRGRAQGCRLGREGGKGEGGCCARKRAGRFEPVSPTVRLPTACHLRSGHERAGQRGRFARAAPLPSLPPGSQPETARVASAASASASHNGMAPTHLPPLLLLPLPRRPPSLRRRGCESPHTQTLKVTHTPYGPSGKGGAGRWHELRPPPFARSLALRWRGREGGEGRGKKGCGVIHTHTHRQATTH